ncbi:MAG: GUN4 domain-containing protein [Nostoc sp.]|uniref:GUN4 domain-containing protein n=1 Tax=Nostoc sp. TaxID=1180 RepID=UPI002FF0B752
MREFRSYQYDIFLSHASEDKIEIATPLYDALNQEYRVWYDQENIKWGDDLNEAINEGLKKSKHGIVILSQNYLRKDKKWTWQELKAILESDRILPILHDIKIEDIQSRYPDAKPILTKLAISSLREDRLLNIDYIIKEAKKAIGEDSLCSERNIDYTRLRDLLKGDTRKEAAKETCLVIIKSIRRSSGNRSPGELWNEDADLITINRLWLKYTNGYFSIRDLEGICSVGGLADSNEAELKTLRSIIGKQLIPKIDEIAVTESIASKKLYENYTRLRDLLKANELAKADRETAFLLLNLTNQTHRGKITGDDIIQLPEYDLRTIDQLWQSASERRFGFSVQKEIWIELCQKYNHQPDIYNVDIFSQFIKKVNWDDDVIVKYSAPKGHLPLGLYVKTTNSEIRDKWESYGLLIERQNQEEIKEKIKNIIEKIEEKIREIEDVVERQKFNNLLEFLRESENENGVYSMALKRLIEYGIEIKVYFQFSSSDFMQFQTKLEKLMNQVIKLTTSKLSNEIESKRNFLNKDINEIESKRNFLNKWRQVEYKFREIWREYKLEELSKYERKYLRERRSCWGRRSFSMRASSGWEGIDWSGIDWSEKRDFDFRASYFKILSRQDL